MCCKVAFDIADNIVIHQERSKHIDKDFALLGGTPSCKTHSLAWRDRIAQNKLLPIGTRDSPRPPSQASLPGRRSGVARETRLAGCSWQRSLGNGVGGRAWHGGGREGGGSPAKWAAGPARSGGGDEGGAGGAGVEPLLGRRAQKINSRWVFAESSALSDAFDCLSEAEESLANQRGKLVSKEETLNKSKRLTAQDSLSSQAQELAAKKDKSEEFYKRSLKILKHSKSDRDKEEAYKLLAKAAKMGNQKAMEKLAANMLFGYNGPQNIKAAVSLYEILADAGSHKGQTALGFMLSYGIGVEHNQAKALVYYTFASIGGSLISKTILGYRFWLGINVPRNCEAALVNYRKVSHFIAKQLEKSEDLPVEKVRLTEKPDNHSSNTEFLDWDVYQYYRFLAERGDTQIQVFLGQLHLLGRKGLKRDHAKAFYYFLKAADAGDPNGMAFLGKMYLEGSAAVVQDNVTALRYFRTAADKGNPLGLCGLGLLYFRGRGVQVNYTEAFKYFKKAAEKGFPRAHLHLGVMYHTGAGVRKDSKLAFQYFYLATQTGEPLAVYHLAEMYATGSGVRRSCQTAVELYRTVCELGRWSEKFLTAYFAYQARQTDPSLVHYLFLAEMGYEVAQINSAYIIESEKIELFRRNQMYPLALLLWNRAATQGNAFARVKMGDYHYYGFGTERDYITAVVHYTLAAEQYSAQAMFNLGYMCEHGIGVSKDIHLARRWYNLAAKTSPDALIPVFLASVKLEATHLLSELQLLNLTGNWKLPDLERILRLHWDLLLMLFIAMLLILLINGRQN
ncbi:protein sel-1 homolog 2 [Heteronotia binoei]|uniref:protein sel-1 homolog 2 n=1 Tax=Heteronotia binoei TaxID=13085 RepID=UPI00292D29E9|nr:protein sel-1 homolog 2 [Heteronotia binoei]